MLSISVRSPLGMVVCISYRRNTLCIVRKGHITMVKRLVVMISGYGSNLQAIIDACQSGELSAQVVAVFSNRKSAYGLERARRRGIPAEYFPLKPYRDQGHSREKYDADLAARVAAYRPDLVVLAGWMHILSSEFIRHFRGRLINLHPALPGTFPGTDAISRAYEAFQQGRISHTGCMVHHVVEEVDAGEPIAQAVVPIYPYDSLADLEARMHKTEHQLLIKAIAELLADM